jgi:hypothetical protein
MEVGIRIEGHSLTGDVTLINKAYFTMVAVPGNVVILRVLFVFFLKVACVGRT